MEVMKMSYMKRYLEWACDRLQEMDFGTYEECMDYLMTTPNEYLPRWINVQAYIKERNKSK
jgi:hypothetical protein